MKKMKNITCKYYYTHNMLQLKHSKCFKSVKC